MAQVHLLSAIVAFCLLFAWGESGPDPPFRGKLVYIHSLNLEFSNTAAVSDELLSLEKADTVTYFVDSDSVVYQEVKGRDGNVRFVRKRSGAAHLIYDYRYNDVQSVGSFAHHNVKESFVYVGGSPSLLGLPCDEYLYSTNKDDNGRVVVAQFPYTLTMKDSMEKTALPVCQHGLKVDSEIRSKVTDELYWTNHRRLISYSYEKDIDVTEIARLFE